MVKSAAVEDVLVFEWREDRFRLIGGSGRGAGWADIVEISATESMHVERAWRGGVPVRVSAGKPIRIAGPYWAASAVLVPVGNAHLVIFGGPSVEKVSEAALVGAAVQAVAGTGAVSAEKLLADELEVVHAVRMLTSYQPVNVRDTARHIATVAARALSCDVAAVRVSGSPQPTLEIIVFTPDALDAAHRPAGRDAAVFLEAAATMPDAMVEQEVGPDPEIWLERVVSRMTLPIAPKVGLGALSLGHAEGRERGFTTMCQRIGRALAESAEPLLAQAIAHQELMSERAEFQRATRTDSLTGIGNRAAWDHALAVLPLPRPAAGYAVLSIDLDELKEINDHYGHSAGDAVLRGAANLLRTVLRQNDVLCRVGGDEFMCLLPDAGEREARAVVRRIERAVESWRVTEHDLRPGMSIGWAVHEKDWPQTVHAADERMYAAKRRHEGTGEPAAFPQSPAQARRRRTDPVPAPATGLGLATTHHPRETALH